VGAVDNTVAIDNGLYVGSFLATGNGQTSMALFINPPSNGGDNPTCGLFNAYNQEQITCHNMDNGETVTGALGWVAGTPGPDNTTPCHPTAPNGGLNNRINFVDGLGDRAYHFERKISAGPFNPADPQGFASTVGFGLDSTSPFIARPVAIDQSSVGFVGSPFVSLSQTAVWNGMGTPGKHFLQCLEGANFTFFYGLDFNLMWATLWM
jgi:hypothetical protein